jgi:hypothetical protein
MKNECPVCYASLNIFDEKMLTCPYCDALLYNTEGFLKRASSYPWWQKKEEIFEKYKRKYNINGLLKAENILELYVFKENNWFLIYDSIFFIKKSESELEFEEYDQKIEKNVTYIYGRIPVFTPLNFKTALYLSKNWIAKKELSCYSLFERVQ